MRANASSAIRAAAGAGTKGAELITVTVPSDFPPIPYPYSAQSHRKSWRARAVARAGLLEYGRLVAPSGCLRTGRAAHLH
jgi:hypothetical protein